VCDAVLFLASPQSTYLSGAVIPLDGGLAARRM
jgi:NAD(P)-dependent dehydrogenase (short-subunit alcohol dehydrogenase family)